MKKFSHPEELSRMAKMTLKPSVHKGESVMKKDAEVIRYMRRKTQRY